VEIIVNTEPLTRYFDDFEQRQVPYALSNTLNDVAKLFQYRERQHIGQQFTVRRKQWVDNSVKITEFATKRKLQATVAIESPGGGKRSDILGKFESQTSKRPRSAPSLFIPVAARANNTAIVPDSLRPKNLHFREVGGSKGAGHASHLSSKRMRAGVLRGGLKVYEGEKRTVMIRNSRGEGVVLQRVGRGKRAGMRLLFTLAPKATLTPNLKFILNARDAVTHVKGFFAARFAEAMSTARR
jgi:hypothetical protein